MRQSDIPAWEALREAVGQIIAADSLESMREIADQLYHNAKTARSRTRYVMVEAFINFVLRRYLQNPLVDPPNDAFLRQYSSEFHAVKHRLKQLGVLK